MYGSESRDPRGREAWSDHRLHTESIYTDWLHFTFIVTLRHRDFIKNMTVGASQADMTLIMVCVSTRQTVQCETVDDDCSREYKRNVAQSFGEKSCAGDDGEVDGEALKRFPSPQLASSTQELEGSTTDLINRLQMKPPSEARAIERLRRRSPS